MESLIHPRWEALTPPTQEALRLLSELKLIQRFYLAGRTGLALHLGHRFSEDLDFFPLSQMLLMRRSVLFCVRS